MSTQQSKDIAALVESYINAAQWTAEVKAE